MGTNSSKTGQLTVSLNSLLRRYEILHKDEQQHTTLVKEKQSQNIFLIKQIAFVQKSFYQKNLCRFSHFQERQQCQNVLNLTKVWTEEHTTLCANTYKIFPMYEYSTVTLKDQIEARKLENKHFEEDQLLGIVQSCVNALNSQPPILVSPSQYFICQDGLLKLNNHDLFDSELLQTFTDGVYYSFEKMENFHENHFYENDQNYLKQAIFSLGITLLSCIYLQEISEKLYSPLHPNKKMRINLNLLESLIKGISSKNKKISYHNFSQMIRRMINQDPAQRLSLDEIQEELDQIVKLRHSRIEIDQTSEKQEFDPEEKMAGIELKVNQNKENKNPVFSGQNLSTIEDKHGKGFHTLKSKDLEEASQMDILREISGSNGAINQQTYCQFQVPLILSKSAQNSRIQPVNMAFNESLTVVEDELPSPVCKENPLFTNPQFLAKINQDIKQFSFKRKNSYASTEFSRKNSNLVLVIENHQPLNNS